MDRGAWRATVHGITKSWTQLKQLSSSDQCKEIEENNRMGKTEISSRNLEIPRDHFMQRWAQLRKEAVMCGPNRSRRY